MLCADRVELFAEVSELITHTVAMQKGIFFKIYFGLRNLSVTVTGLWIQCGCYIVCTKYNTAVNKEVELLLCDIFDLHFQLGMRFWY